MKSIKITEVHFFLDKFCRAGRVEEKGGVKSAPRLARASGQGKPPFWSDPSPIDLVNPHHMIRKNQTTFPIIG
jgi:hypothetical protein